ARQLRVASPGEGNRDQRAVEERPWGGRAAEFLRYQAQFDQPLASAVVLLGHGEADPPKLRTALPKLVVEVCATARQRTHQLRRAAYGEHAAGHLAKGGLFLRKLEVHVGAP